NQPGRRIDLRVDTDHLALEFEIIVRQAEPDGLADPEIGQLLLRDGEVHTHRVEVLQCGHHVAGRQVLTDIDLRNADRSGEGSGDPLLVEYRLEAVDLTRGSRCGRLRLLDVRLWTDLPLLQLDGAFEVLLV